MRFGLPEISGALGDLGLFIPLMVSLVLVCGMDAGSILVFAGLFNIITGLMFNQPIPVQPMKAIAAVAIAEGLSPGSIAAAGFSAGLIVLILGLTGLVTWAEKVIPRPVVRGIQLGVGLKLAAKGIGMVMGIGWLGWDSRIIAIGAGLLILFTFNFKRFPSALILFVGGLTLMLFSVPAVFTNATLGWGGFAVTIPSLNQWSEGFFLGTLPQVPLTLLNSVIAVCALSGDLFPGKKIKTRTMAVSVGLMNIGACLFGGMPMCHGSGGLAGQYRFGARTGGSVVMLGVAKMAVGLLFGAAAISIIASFPVSLLGALLIFAGLELTLPARESHDKNAFFVIAATAGGILAANTLVGFIFGLITAMALLKPSKGTDAGQ